MTRKPTKQPASEGIKRHLLQRISHGHYKPRERLIEQDLAREFGCSRGPVREAIQALESEGFVRVVPRRGTFVVDHSPAAMRSTGEIRYKLEALCVRYLRQKGDPSVRLGLQECVAEMEASAKAESNERFLTADMKFHRTIWEAGGNEELVRILDSLLKRLMWWSRQWVDLSLADRVEIHREYLQLVYETPMSKVEATVEKHLNELTMRRSGKELQP